MSEREEDAVKELENAEVTELEDKDLEDVAGGNTNCGCVNSPCAEDQL